LSWRIVIDFWKPQPLIGGMNLIQWSCLAGILLLVLDVIRLRPGASHDSQYSERRVYDR